MRTPVGRAGSADLVERLFQRGDGARDVVQLVQPEQPDAEGLVVGAFVAGERNAGRGRDAVSELDTSVTYRRLRQYARPYWGLIAIGILAMALEAAARCAACRRLSG